MIIPLLFCILAVANGQTIRVTTVEGIIEGYAATDEEYYTFHGIPYAQSRVGQDMFRPSIPPPDLPGIFHAYDSSIECARPSPNGMIGVINCLVLNVFTNNITASKPVLVWLKGEESNPAISSKYSYRRLLNEDVVVVTLNYRLSVFGFLCLKTEQNPGNSGLKDIILGLQWIQRNIAVFGGNPNNVVLMGHGSAAAMAELITLTPQSENLVHKVVALSGSALAPWAISHDPIGAAVTLNTVNGGGLQSIDDITTFLAQNSLNEINTALNRFKYTNNTQMFAPCLENPDLEGALLTNFPINLLRAANSYKDIPYITGYATREGTIRAEEAISDSWLDKMQSDFTDFLPVDLDFGNNLESGAASIRNFYFDSVPINMTLMDNYLEYHGDTMSVVPIIRGIQERIKTTTSDAWLLVFGFMGTNNSDWNQDVTLNGARHGSILNYIFDFDLFYNNDEVVANTLVKRIAGFAYTGIPQADGWTIPRPFTQQSSSYLIYMGRGATGQLAQLNLVNPHQTTMSFWNQLYDTYYMSTSSAVGLKGLLSVVLLSFILLIIV